MFGEVAEQVFDLSHEFFHPPPLQKTAINICVSLINNIGKWRDSLQFTFIFAERVSKITFSAYTVQYKY